MLCAADILPAAAEFAQASALASVLDALRMPYVHLSFASPNSPATLHDLFLGAHGTFFEFQ